MLLAGLALWAASAFAQQAQPKVSWSVSPDKLRPGEEAVVTVDPFASWGWTCRAFFSLHGGAQEFRCGANLAQARLKVPDNLMKDSLNVLLTVCAAQRGGKPACWTASKTVPAEVPVDIPDPDDAPDRGVLRTGAAGPSLLRSGPSGPPVPLDEELLDRLRGKKGRIAVRGLDGRVYYRETEEGSAQAKEEAFQTALLKDDAVRQGYDRWDELDEPQRLAVLQRVTGLQSDAYGVPPPPVSFARLGRPGLLGKYNPNTGEVQIDPTTRQFRDRDYAFMTAAHEARHGYQDQLERKLDAGVLTAGSEDHALAQAFKASRQHYCCRDCRRSCDYETYRSQLIEQDAFEHGEGAVLYLKSKVSRATYDEYLRSPGG